MQNAAHARAKSERRREGLSRRVLSYAVLAAGCAVLIWMLVTELRASAPAAQTPVDYTKFEHTSFRHARLPCLLCHTRTDNSTRPKFSGHLPCSGCHVQQFNDPQSGICTVCHVSTQGGALKAFPPLRSFNLRFDHGRHQAGVACATCHRPLARGAALSIPARAQGHTTCFQCHTPQAKNRLGDNISSCDTCHRLGTLVRTPTQAAAFRVGFSHARHTAQQGVSCANCHTVRPGATRSNQVTAPAAFQHHTTGRGQSCITCHNGKRAFGGDDFTSCKRCHQPNHFYF
jgi:c(7)-type cytochrome triheme protein